MSGKYSRQSSLTGSVSSDVGAGVGVAGQGGNVGVAVGGGKVGVPCPSGVLVSTGGIVPPGVVVGVGE